MMILIRISFVLLFLIRIQVSYVSCQEFTLKFSDLVPCTQQEITIHDSINNHYYGIAGNGFIGDDEWIGFCEAKYKWGGPWRPIDGYKRTLCGYAAVKKYNSKRKSIDDPSNYHLVSKGDGDIVFYLIPDPAFRWLQFQSLRPQGHYFKDFSIACEIALKEPGNTVETDGETFIQDVFLEKFQYKHAGVYGPWVSDVGHESSPEIHPIQQMWVKNKLEGGATEYLLLSMYDNSSRFNSPDKFDDTCGVKKWQDIPMHNKFFLPFSIYMNEKQKLVYDIRMPSSFNINQFDSASSHLSLIVDDVEKIKIARPGSNFPSVKIVNICRSGNDLIFGYILIETSVGKVISENGGHAFLQVTLRHADE